MDSSPSSQLYQLPGASGCLAHSISFLLYIQGQTVAVLSDNTTAVSYINRQGSLVSRSLCTLVLRVKDFCIIHHNTPAVAHFQEYKTSLQTHWAGAVPLLMNGNSTFPSFNHFFRPGGHLNMDVFISRINLKYDTFCSGGRGRLSLPGDGLLLDWRSCFLCLFPPLPLIPQVLLNKRSMYILIAPGWPHQNWFP